MTPPVNVFVDGGPSFEDPPTVAGRTIDPTSVTEDSE